MNEEPDTPTPPKKKKNILDPRSTLSGNVSAQIDINDEEVAFLNSMLQASMDRYKTTVERETKDLKQDIESLQGIVTEYLSDFIIIGHTFDDRRVILRYAPSPKGYDALKELTREYLTRMVLGERLDPLDEDGDD